jgi:hypothetical protein
VNSAGGKKYYWLNSFPILATRLENFTEYGTSFLIEKI